MSKNYNFFKFKSYFLLVSLLFFSKAFSTNWYVNDNSTTGDFYCTAIGSNTNNGTSQATPKLTLGAAITAASPGDTIFIDTGTYSGTGNINLTVAKANLTFTGAGSLKTIFDNNFASANTNYWLNITANNININGISGTEFNAVSTGKVVTINGQTVTFNDVVFFNNSSNGNGAIYITSNSNVTYSNSNNTCNAQFLFGGGIDVLGDNCIVNITNCIIATNRKADNGNGGGLYVRGLGNNVTVTNTRFEQNDAVNGGAICVVGGKIATPNTLTINGSCFNNNKASQVSSTVLGGAVSILRGAATVNITDSSFTNNQAGSGSMTGRGGAILINTNTDVIVSGSGLSGTGNVALNLEKCSFSNNNATSGGKHIYADEGTGREIVVNINQCTFASVGNFDIAQNTPTEAVFNITNSGSPTVSNLSLSNTTAPTQTAVTVCQPFTGDGCSLPAPCTASLSYPNSSICSSASTQTPTFSPIGGTFTSTTGLSINASTGVITPSSSTAGTYTITYTPNSADPTCKATFSITIVAAPVQPTIACYQTATFNTTTCSWDVTGTQPVQPTTACYQTATFNTTTCSWDVTGTQPAQPTTACYQTATWNPTSCQYDITGTQPTTPTVLCYQTATWNPTSCQYDITGTQPTAPTVLCYQTATWNPTSCQYDITGTQPVQPTTACYQTATFNTTTCSWDVTGTQPAQPTTACYQTATFNTATCSWDVTGTQPAQPTTACYQTATFNTTTCAWDVTGTQPAQPTTACYQTATFNTTTCSWDVTGTQPAQPTTTCYQTATFNTTTCSWDVTGTQPAQPTTACYQTATFNTTTCSWVLTGTQPVQPTTACYQTATFNTTTCAWDVTGTQPAQPTTACYQTATFNTATCSWDVTGTQPAQPTTACYQTATFNTNTCSWDVTGTLPVQPTTACYQTATWNQTSCQYDITGTQPTAPTVLCYQIATWNPTSCQYDVTGTQPTAPTVLCYQTATWNPTSCQYDVTGTQPTAPTVLCYQTATWNPTSCQYDVTGTQPTAPTVLCYQTATWNPTSCQYDITGTQQAAPTIGQINQPSCLSSVGIFQINAFDSNYIYSFIPAVINISSTGLVTANPGTYTLTMINNLGCASQTSANIVVNQQPSLVAPLITVNNAICNGSTYSVSFNTNGTISASTGTISGNIITGIAVGTNVVLSATSLNGCATTNMTVTSPASCITPRGCVTPTLSAGQGVCSGIGTYSFAFNVSDNATITSSAGTISGNTVINIPIGVVVTLTAIDGLCSTSLQINSPSNCSTPCASPVVSFSAGICNGNTYSINISNPNNAIITSSVGTVTTNAIIGIPTGTSVMITSVISGCSPQVITILSPNKIAPLLIISNAICNGSTYSVEYTSNGNVTSTFGSVNGDSITDIPIGTNIILIATSLNGCATTSMTVVSPTNCSNPPSNCIMPTLSAGQGTCSGTGTYSFAFNASAGAAVSVSSGTIIGNTVTGITVGTNVTLTATNGSCVTSLVVNSPTDCSTPCATPVVSFSAGICNGTTYSINISNPNAATITASAGNVTATNISNIPVGTNVIITSLTAGCSAQIISVFSSQLAVTPFAGNDGNLTVCENVTPTNAELFNALGGIPHNGGTWSNSGNVYTYTVQANSACSSIPFHSATVTINETIINNFAITGECVNENYQLSVSPIQNGVTYNWYDSNDTLLGTGTSIIINDNGTYHVESNLTNCKKIATITIENSNCIIPKGISPNGDGLNDSWNLSNLNIEKAQIFNRYGMEMFSKSNYTSEWHGQTNSGHILPSATYYYVLTLPGGMVRTGWVYLNREN